MSSHSDELAWCTIKRNSAFVKKFNGITLSSEWNNVSAQHSKKTSGLLPKSVAIASKRSDKNGLRIMKVVSKPEEANHPIKRLEIVPLRTCRKTHQAVVELSNQHISMKPLLEKKYRLLVNAKSN